jgi:hypothetical protein
MPHGGTHSTESQEPRPTAWAGWISPRRLVLSSRRARFTREKAAKSIVGVCSRKIYKLVDPMQEPSLGAECDPAALSVVMVSSYDHLDTRLGRVAQERDCRFGLDSGIVL